MIENDQQLETTCQALGSAYLALAALRQELLPLSAERYDLAAQAALRQIGKLRGDVDAYLGLDQAEPLHVPPPFTIQNDEQLRGTHEAVGHLYRALAALRKDLSPASRNYRLYAQGNIDEIRKLQAEIDAYLGRTETAPQAVTLREAPPNFGQSKST